MAHFRMFSYYSDVKLDQYTKILLKKKKDPNFYDLVIENFKSVNESAEFNFI